MFIKEILGRKIVTRRPEQLDESWEEERDEREYFNKCVQGDINDLNDYVSNYETFHGYHPEQNKGWKNEKLCRAKERLELDKQDEDVK